MNYKSASIEGNEQGVSTLWNKMLTIKKTKNPYDYSKRIYLKLKITSVVTSLWDSLAPKQTILEISHVKKSDTDTDTWNTHIKATDFTETKIKVFEDEDHFYFYFQNYSLIYYNYINIEVMEEIGEFERIQYHFEAPYELLPEVTESLQEYPIILTPGYEYQYKVGANDWQKSYKLFTVKMDNDWDYRKLNFTITSLSANIDYSQKVEIFVHTDNSYNRFNVNVGKIYVKDVSTTEETIYEVYSNCFGPGISPKLIFNYLEKVESNNIIMNLNNVYELLDTSDPNLTLVESEENQKNNIFSKLETLAGELEKFLLKAGDTISGELVTRELRPISGSLFDLGTNNIPYKSGFFTDNITTRNGYVKTGYGATPPTGLYDTLCGSMYFDTTLGKPVWWNGTNWIDATKGAIDNSLSKIGDAMLGELVTRELRPLSGSLFDLGMNTIPYRNGYFSDNITTRNGYIKTGYGTTRPSGMYDTLCGAMYFDTTLGKPVWWNGTNWIDAIGNTI